MKSSRELQKTPPAKKVQQTDGTPNATQGRGGQGVYAPRVDVVETADAFLMFADMPGVRPDDVSLHCQEGQLILHGRCAPRNAGKKPLHREYGVGDFYRTFTISDAVDSNKIEARMEAGVLMVTLPKSERAKPKRIAVKSS